MNRVITQIKELGLKVGVALNPATPLSVLEYVLEYVDMVLIMTVNPGFGGQTYIENSTKKIHDLRKMINERHLNIDIEVDGGIKLHNVKEVLDAGANIIVAGSTVFNENTLSNASRFLEILSGNCK